MKKKFQKHLCHWLNIFVLVLRTKANHTQGTRSVSMIKKNVEWQFVQSKMENTEKKEQMIQS